MIKIFVELTLGPQFDALMNDSKSGQFLAVSCGQTLQNHFTVSVTVQRLHRSHIHLSLVFVVNSVDREVLVSHIFYENIRTHIS